MFWRRFLAGVLMAGCAHAQNFPRPSSWSVVKNSHFEIYSQSGPENARASLQWFEELREFFSRDALLGKQVNLVARPPVRVIGFRSPQEYDAFRLRPTADAFYAGTETRDYIVMPALDRQEFPTAAHEYAHLVLRNSQLQLPLWLTEGLAEFFSTVRLTNAGSELGGELPMRMQTLQHEKLLPLTDLFAVAPASLGSRTRAQIGLFYAESWALTDLLITAAAYAGHWSQLLLALDSGTPAAQAIEHIYAKPLAAITADLDARLNARRFTPVLLPPLLYTDSGMQSRNLSSAEEIALMADMLAASGQLDRARSLYAELATRTPADPDIPAALGTIALRKGDRIGARQNWKLAIERGVNDPLLCFQYAVLAEEQGLSASEIRPALERAVALKPDFDDALYQLAILENNAADYRDALRPLRAMRSPARKRAFAYWSATANALTELGDRNEAVDAAGHALQNAETDSDRQRAREFAYIAQTDLTVQFAQDGQGHSHLVTTRVPHGTVDFNPFIEPQDHIVRTEGNLREVECRAGQLIGFIIASPAGPLTLSVPDPLRVQMKNSPAEFGCGAQPATRVRVVYAAADQTAKEGVLRGMEFP